MAILVKKSLLKSQAKSQSHTASMVIRKKLCSDSITYVLEKVQRAVPMLAVCDWLARNLLSRLRNFSKKGYKVMSAVIM